MKTKYIFQVIAILAAVLITAGCNRELTLKTKLAPEEKAGKGDAVLVDGIAAGYVKKVVDEGGQRIAVLAITDQTVVKEKIRVGVVRVLEDGRMSLRTDETDPKSPLLTSGAIVPVMSKTGFEVRHLASNKVLEAAIIGFAVIVLVIFSFRRLARVWLLFLALLLSCWSAWLVLPWASAAVTKIYTHLPQANSPVSANATQGGGVKSTLLQFIHNPPPPEIVAYCGVFLVVFVVLSICVFGSVKRFENQN